VVAAPLGVEAGATLPQGPGEQETVHATPLLLELLVKVAVSWLVPPAITVAVGGFTVMPTEGTVTVTVADLVMSVMEVPVSVIDKLLVGGAAGAV